MREALIGALAGGLGAAAMVYVFDPVSGRGRRAHARDKWVHARHELHEAVETTRSDLRNRLHGLEHELRARLRHQEVDDTVLLERVRAALGHAVSHPGPIHVEVREGVVTLRGPILGRELPFALARVRAVRGVHELKSELEAHAEPGREPALQGQRMPVMERATRNWSPTARLFAGVSGAALVAGSLFGARRRMLRGLLGVLLLGRAAVPEIRPIERQRTRGRFDVPTHPSPAQPESSG